MKTPKIRFNDMIFESASACLLELKLALKSRRVSHLTSFHIDVCAHDTSYMCGASSSRSARRLCSRLNWESESLAATSVGRSGIMGKEQGF